MPSPDPQKRLAAGRAWRAANRDKIRERKRAAYAADAENQRARVRKYRKANPEAVLAYNRAWRQKFFGALRRELVAAYGGKCACCGESEYAFLDLDHVNNDGRADRAERGNGQRLYVWLKANGWPRDRYQLLCCNCNQGKARNGGGCPHATRRSA